MDSYFESEFGRNEIIPPVPAPRYKRRNITLEDSKNTHSIKQNTCESDESLSIRPPPRRKEKSRYNQNNKIIPFHYTKDQNDNEENESKDANCAKDEKTVSNNIECELIGVESMISTNIPQNSFSIYNNNLLCCTETNKDIKKPLELVPLPNILNKVSNEPVITSYIVEKGNILENVTENRVLDIPLEINATSSSSYLDDNSSDLGTPEVVGNNIVSDKPATIVGVFYKSQCCSLNAQRGEACAYSTQSNEFGSSVSLRIDNINNSYISGSVTDSKKIDTISIKDLEEGDSGIFCCDRKSPTPGGNHLENIKKIHGREIMSYSECDLQFHKSVHCNYSDTCDNKSSEDLGPQGYEKMLDYFEARTVSASREELSSRLSLCSGEVNKHSAAQDGLRKQMNISFSEYMKNMLETDNSSGSWSPHPIRAADKDYGSEIDSNNTREAERLEKTTDKESVLEACTDRSSIAISIENSKLALNNTVGSTMNSVHTNIVNSDDNEVTQSKVININNSFNSDEFNTNITSSFHGLFSTIESNNVLPTSETHFNLDNKHVNFENMFSCIVQDNEKNMQLLPSPKHGAVISLISYFEKIKPEGCEAFNTESGEHFDIVHNFEEKCEIYSENSSYSSGESESMSTPDTHIISKDCVEAETNTGNMLMDGTSIGLDSYDSLPLLHSIYNEKYFSTSNDTRKYIESDNIQLDCKEMIENCSFNTTFDSNLFKNSDSCNKTEDLDKDEFLDIKNVIACDNQILQINNNQPKTEFHNHIHGENMLFYITNNDLSENQILSNSVNTSMENCQNKSSIDNKVQLKYPIYQKDSAYQEEVSSNPKSTRIPIVIVTDDIVTSEVGSLELHLTDSATGNVQDLGKSNDFQEAAIEEASRDFEYCEGDKSLLKDSFTVHLEKHWGSLGLKIRGGDDGIIISDILRGGVTEKSGLVFKGFLEIKSLAEEKEIFC